MHFDVAQLYMTLHGGSLEDVQRKWLPNVLLGDLDSVRDDVVRFYRENEVTGT